MSFAVKASDQQIIRSNKLTWRCKRLRLRWRVSGKVSEQTGKVLLPTGTQVQKSLAGFEHITSAETAQRRLVRDGTQNHCGERIHEGNLSRRAPPTGRTAEPTTPPENSKRLLKLPLAS